MSNAALRLSLDTETFDFAETPLTMGVSRVTDVFASKNNKTLGETIRHPRYLSLASRVQARYPSAVETRLGDFLRGLKRSGDSFYREFLNPYGDGEYCEFKLADPRVKKQKGLYCFTMDGMLKYIGKSSDSFARRINQGYGAVHPKNCYRDGQATRKSLKNE